MQCELALAHNNLSRLQAPRVIRDSTHTPHSSEITWTEVELYAMPRIPFQLRVLSAYKTRFSTAIKNPFPYPLHRNPTPHEIFHLPRDATPEAVKRRCKSALSSFTIDFRTIPQILNSSEFTIPTLLLHKAHPLKKHASVFMRSQPLTPRSQERTPEVEPRRTFRTVSLFVDRRSKSE